MKYTTHYTSVEKIVWEFDKTDLEKIIFDYLDTNKFLKTIDGTTQALSLEIYEKDEIGGYTAEFTIKYEKEAEKPADSIPPPELETPK